MAAAAAAARNDVDHGFSRAGMFQDPLAGTVSFYERHVFVCYKDSSTWPANAELEGLPRQLATSLKARKKDMTKKVRLTVYEEGEEARCGDILVFPDAIRYRAVSACNVDAFVEQVLVNERPWEGGGEKLTCSYVFVCAHGSRDARCGACGPPLVQSFREEAVNRGLRIVVAGCSHIGGHKYAGNVIIFSGTPAVTGHWYGYVTPSDVPALLDQHICKGQIVDKLWRGQMSLSEEEQKQAQQQRQQQNGYTSQLCPCGMSQEMCGMANNGAVPLRNKSKFSSDKYSTKPSSDKYSTKSSSDKYSSKPSSDKYSTKPSSDKYTAKASAKLSESPILAVSKSKSKTVERRTSKLWRKDKALAAVTAVLVAGLAFYCLHKATSDTS